MLIFSEKKKLYSTHKICQLNSSLTPCDNHSWFVTLIIWNELHLRSGGRACDLELEVGRKQAFDPDLEAVRPKLLTQILGSWDEKSNFFFSFNKLFNFFL